MRTPRSCLLLTMMFLFIFLTCLMAAPEGKKQPTSQELVRDAVRVLVKIQEDNGKWPYQQPQGEFPVWQVASTSIVTETLLLAAPNDAAARTAVQRGLAYVLKQLDNADWMVPFPTFRIWSHAYALELLCLVRAHKMTGEHGKKVDEWIPRLIKALIKDEVRGGGWTYEVPGSPAVSFVTATVTQALLLARSQGGDIPDELFKRARKALEAARTKEGAFVYQGAVKDNKAVWGAGGKSLGGSVSRRVISETTLMLLGGSSSDAVQSALDNFHKYWDKLEKRRVDFEKDPDDLDFHAPPYGIAPYYFCYSHRYAAQAIQMLPREKRGKERQRLLATILKTRNADGTWNDMADPRARSYGTAMMVLALLGDKTPLPPQLAKKGSRKEIRTP